MKLYRYLLLALFSASPALAQDAEPATETQAESDAAEQEAAASRKAADPNQPRTMSGMSILGNEEAPKALVIIPWKSSELGDEMGMPEHLDDRATPVDRDVFLRELHFYEIRKGDE
jgi:hypothetical protein